MPLLRTSEKKWSSTGEYENDEEESEGDNRDSSSELEVGKFLAGYFIIRSIF